MANLNAERVGVGAGKATGAIFVAPTSVALPTDATTALPQGYVCVGYTSTDGVTVSESSTSSAIRAWEGLATVYTSMSEYTEQVAFKTIQLDADGFKLIWGDDAVTVDSQTGAIAIAHSGDTVEPKNIVIEMVPRSGIVRRLAFTAQPTSRDSETFNGTDAAGRTVTFDCVAGSDGKTMHDYIAFTD